MTSTSSKLLLSPRSKFDCPQTAGDARQSRTDVALEQADWGHVPAEVSLSTDSQSVSGPPTTPPTRPSRDRPRNPWAPEAVVVAAELLTTGTVDANVDMRCAVRLSALMRRGCTLPVVRLPWTVDEMYDVCGRRRSRATIGHFRRGVKPGNWGRRFDPEPLTDDEIVSLLAVGGSYPAAVRDRALTAVLLRSGLRPYYPPGPVFCVVEGATKGSRMSASTYRTRLHKLGVAAGITKRVHPHGCRHSLAVGMDREGFTLPVIQQQMRHSNPGITGIYLRGMSNAYVVEQVGSRRRPDALADKQPSHNLKIDGEGV